MSKRSTISLIGVGVTLAALVGCAGNDDEGAIQSDEVSTQDEADSIVQTAASSGYYFRPGDPTFFGKAGGGAVCTGGYAIHGTEGTFILSDEHCARAGTAVYGASRRFGTVAFVRSQFHDTLDSSLIREVAGDGIYQIVRDPKTKRVPGGSGKVVGALSSSKFTKGLLIGKMGVTSGWTEGKIYGWSSFPGGLTVYCYDAKTQAGDSGGPVWRTAPNGGVYALGIVVTYNVAHENQGCFLPIDGLLKRWGATLPAFSSGSAQKAVSGVASTSLALEADEPPVDLPEVDISEFAPAVGW